jgi:hypothetical protein
MSQNDFNIANQGFPSFRSDLNSALQALASTSSGDTEPATTYANQLWYDTAENVLKIRNEANSAWLDALSALAVTATAAELNVLDGVTATTSELNQLDGLEVYGKTNILGTVSETSGVPTGAVIERGSNANGEFVKFADGTMQCFHRLQLTFSVTSEINATWTFPAAFSGSPRIASIISDDGTSMAPVLSQVTNPSISDAAGASSTTLRLFRFVGATNFVSGDTCFVETTAIGRWF